MSLIKQRRSITSSAECLIILRNDLRFIEGERRSLRCAL
nr:MAG TPA: hypothetical protein [Caudoviricetes sp.]